MSWEDAREQLIEIIRPLTAIAQLASGPQEISLATVYEQPPDQVQSHPCVIVYPPGKAVQRGASGRRTKDYELRCLFLIADYDLETSTAICDAFGDALQDAFDSAVTLHGRCALLEGPDLSAPAAFAYASDTANFIGMNCLFRIRIIEAREFSA